MAVYEVIFQVYVTGKINHEECGQTKEILRNSAFVEIFWREKFRIEVEKRYTQEVGRKGEHLVFQTLLRAVKDGVQNRQNYP